MAEVEEESRYVRSKVKNKRSSERGPGQEIVRVEELLLLLEKRAKKSLAEGVTGMFDSLDLNIKAGHVPSAKFVIDMVLALAKLEGEASAAAYDSLAEVLWKAVEEAEIEIEGR